MTVRVLVTGGCGFIGSHLVRLLISKDYEVVNLDKLTYAGNPKNLADIENHPHYSFLQGDIVDREIVRTAMEGAEFVFNLAAESHVDRSIDNPEAFLETNFRGVYVLCETARSLPSPPRFVQVSTDEVYGSIEKGAFKESDPFSPSSPYAAAKAAGELLAFSYHKTYGLDVVATRGSNTYGPFQYPEKLIPFFVTEILEGRNVPLYGDGRQVRDWLYVEDHARAILHVATEGRSGEAYNIPGGNEKRNKELTLELLKILGVGEERIERVGDRPGHDRRYSVTGKKLAELGFERRMDFSEGIRYTVEWYRRNESWWRPLKEASKVFFERFYGALGRK
ncbi:MAG: dTDP-glucose 4,6-dehydratase [Candidatus Hydrogenedentota bacterium]|nr:MAG: dTDP-glucose 4,6-dehydratase [Candidatus Hydrogenedentota bacterium]